MKLEARLGSATWGGDGHGILFLDGDRIVSAGSDGWFRIFDLKTGLPVFEWEKTGEQLNCVTTDGLGTFYLGGSYGVLYTLKWDGKDDLQIIEERDVFSYTDLIAISSKHRVIAVSCFDELCLLPTVGESEVLRISFTGEIRSLQWVEKLDAFLVASGSDVFTVTPHGKRATVATFDTTVRSAAFSAASDSLVVCRQVWRNDIELLEIKIGQTTPLWTVPLKVNVKVHDTSVPHQGEDDPISIDSCKLHIIESTGEILVTGWEWLARFSSDGREIGERFDTIELLTDVTASTDGKYFAVGTLWTAMYVWNRDGQPVHQRTCHTSPVGALLFEEDDKRLYSAGFSPEVLAWDLSQKERLWKRTWNVSSCDGLSKSSNGSVLVSLYRYMGMTDQDSFVEIVPLDGQTGNMGEAVIIKNEGSAYVETLSDSEYAVAYDGPKGVIEIVDSRSMKVLESFTGVEYAFQVYAIHGALIVAADNYRVWMWRRGGPATGRDFALPDRETAVGFVLSDDESFIAISAVAAYRFASPRFKRIKIVSFAVPVASVSRPVQGMVVIGYENGTAEVRSTQDLKVLHQSWLAHPMTGISAATIAESGKLVATGGNDGTIATWSFD